MSTGGGPISGLLGGMTPGVQAVFFRGPDGRFAGGAMSQSTLVPSVSFNVGPGRNGVGQVPSISFDGMGMPKGGSFNSNGFRSNTFVQKQYMVNSFRSNIHYQMIQGQFVWLYHNVQEITNDQKKSLVYTAVTLPMLNDLLNKAWRNYQTLLASKDPEALEVEALRRKVPEAVLVEYARTQLPMNDTLRTAHEYQGDDSKTRHEQPLVDDSDVARLYSYAIKSDAWALILAPHFVWKRYVFAGSILSLTHGTSVGDSASYDRTGRISVLNLVVCNMAEVHDVFTPVKHMQARAKLFFHLKRRHSGAFFIDPIVVANAPTPEGNATYAYYDATGCGATGLLYELGYVHQEPDGDDNESVHERASGKDIIGDAESMKKATASCRKIFIQMHKYN